MADKTHGSGRGKGAEKNPRTERRQIVGRGQISREPATGRKVGGEENTSQQSDADQEGASQQTSTATDQSGEL